MEQSISLKNMEQSKLGNIDKCSGTLPYEGPILVKERKLVKMKN